MTKKRHKKSAQVAPVTAAKKTHWLYKLLWAFTLLLLISALLLWYWPNLMQLRDAWFGSVHQSNTRAPLLASAISKAKHTAMVDEQSCQSCHSAQVQAWQGSHHHLAMQLPSEQTVLGDFNAVTFKSAVETTKFFRKEKEFWVRTPGPDGVPADFKVAYTFGVEPLQQYLLALPGGRYQALGVAWDTQKKHWFHLYPGQKIDSAHPLHWTKTAQNANYMCIECHTSGFKRNFNAAQNSFASHWQALGVGCQSCHGPASEHLEWAKHQDTSLARKGFEQPLLSQATPTQQVETCARCHALRAPLGDGYQHSNRLLDDYQPSPLNSTQYEVDGTIKGEVFEYGSFTQSKMFAKGVTCTNCHNPHSGALKLAGNAVCTQCHNATGTTAAPGVDGTGLQAKNYDSPEHTKHAPGSSGAECVACHMPGQFYMVNDFRHDHSFSVPNPEQSKALATSDACAVCHQGKQQDIRAQFARWYPQAIPKDGGYAAALHKARTGAAGAAVALHAQLARTDLPAIRRAALLVELANYPAQQALSVLQSALQDSDPQVREAAVRTIPALAAAPQVGQALTPLLGDPVRAVRLAATWELAQQPAEARQGIALTLWQQKISEYEQVQLGLLERGEANLNLAGLYQMSGRTAEVEAALRRAVQSDPDFLPGVVSLAQWLEAAHPQEARHLLQETLRRHPDEAMLYHAQGLALVRARQYVQAIEAFGQADRLAPYNPQYGYVLAIALYDQGHSAQAIAQLQKVLKRQPQNRLARMALFNYAQAAQDVALIQQIVGDLWEINPEDPLLQNRLPKAKAP